MPRQIKLYRGDSIPKSVSQSPKWKRGQTFANHFCGSGLMAKFSHGGSSRLLEGRELPDLVLVHVGYEIGKPEQELAYHSPLLSFSECLDSAFRFSNRKRSELEPCEFYEASHFVWQLEVTLDQEKEPGRYAFKYQSDFINCEKIVCDELCRGQKITAQGGPLSAVAMPLMDGIAGAYADADQSEHYAEIIDVVTFINARGVLNCDPQLVKNTLERATRDSEWLLYPMDPMPDGLGYSGRLTMNEHLSVFCCFRMKNKNQSSPP
jgi:hypothetical protein